jgi:hypothetical protein
VAKVTRKSGEGRKRLEAALASLDGRAGRVGWLDSAKYPDKAGTPVAYVASIHEYGYAPKGIPPRMGMRQMADDKQSEWARVAEHGAKKVIAGEATGDDMLELIGGVAEGDLRKQIKSVLEPALKPSTLANRARRMGIPVETLSATGAKPLNDTGTMIAHITHNVGPAGGDDEKGTVK